MSDDLEAELVAFRPVEPSPELERRLAGRLNDHPEPLRPARGATAALVVWAAIAALILVMARPRPEATPDRPAPVAEPASLPTYAALRRAAAESPETLDALLAHFESPAAGGLPVTIRSDPDLFR